MLSTTYKSIFCAAALVGSMAMCSCGDSDPKPGPGTPDKPVTPDTPAETKDVRVITTTSNR